LLNNELTKNTCVVRQRQFRVIDLEKRLWLRDESVLLPSGHPPHKITNLVILVPRGYHLADTKVSQNLQDLFHGQSHNCKVSQLNKGKCSNAWKKNDSSSSVDAIYNYLKLRVLSGHEFMQEDKDPFSSFPLLVLFSNSGGLRRGSGEAGWPDSEDSG
jgi:hypothetical protein